MSAIGIESAGRQWLRDVENWGTSFSPDFWTGVVVGVALIIATLFMAAVARAIRKKVMLDGESQRPPETAEQAIYFLEPRWMSADRFYKIYLTREGLFGAWVAGQFHDPESVRIQLLVWPLVPLVTASVMGARRESEATYDSLARDPDSILPLDERNFVLRPTEILSIRVRTPPLLWTCYSNKGSLAIELRDGTAYDFIVRVGMGVTAVVDRFAKLGYPVLR